MLYKQEELLQEMNMGQGSWLQLTSLCDECHVIYLNKQCFIKVMSWTLSSNFQQSIGNEGEQISNVVHREKWFTFLHPNPEINPSLAIQTLSQKSLKQDNELRSYNGMANLNKLPYFF